MSRIWRSFSNVMQMPLLWAAVPCVAAVGLPDGGKSRIDTRKIIANALTGDGVLFEKTTGVKAERGRELLSNMVRLCCVRLFV